MSGNIRVLMVPTVENFKIIKDKHDAVKVI